MRISTRFSDSIHILAFMNIYSNIRLSSDTIAGSVETSPVVIRRLMSALRKAGLITTKRGNPEPKLAKPPTQITLLEIYFAVEGERSLFELDKKTNPACIVGGNIQSVLGGYYEQAKLAAQEKLRSYTLQDVIDDILKKENSKNKLI